MARSRRYAGATIRVATPQLVDLDAAARYVFSVGTSEPRARIPLWDECARHRTSQCLEVIDSDANSVTVRQPGQSSRQLSLVDEGSFAEMCEGASSLYIDISGLPMHVWAPLLSFAFRGVAIVRVVYVEPREYKRHPNPTLKTEYDLSDGFRGLEPLPGFAKLTGPADEADATLVAMLGFEGRRASHLALSLDPVPDTYAIVGVPGFRLEHPQIAHASNESFLTEYGAQSKIRFAAAGCPFEAFDILADLRKDLGEKYMYIAPIGTKPHAVGAICFALTHRHSTEIMYDHPTKKSGRTIGVGLTHIYTVKPSHVAP